MTPADWRDPMAYEEVRSLDAPGFAWEYLRRNPEFEAERRRLEQLFERGALAETDKEAFARHWGVRFHAGP